MLRTDSLVRAAARVLLPIALLAGGAGCSREAATRSEPAAIALPPATAAQLAQGSPTARAGSERALAVSVDVSLTVDKVDDVAAAIREDVERTGGWIADGSTDGEGAGRTSRIDLRIPKGELGAFRARLASKGEVTRSTEKVEDVTEAHADLEARLKSARIQEKRIQEIMSGKTATIAEVLEGEKELARIRENVERLEAQKRTMDGRITMATVKVTLSPHRAPPPPAAWKTPAKSIVGAAEDGCKGAAAVAVYVAMAAATAGPTVLPIGVLVAAIVLGIRRRQKRESGARARLLAQA